MRKAVDGSAVAIMLSLCLVWGLQQVAIKGIATDVSPMLQVALRSGAAALLVWLFSRLVARDRWLPGMGRSGLLVGLLFAAEFLFLTEGLRWTTASRMAVFLYTAPLFAAIGLHFKVPGERLSARQWLGMALAFAGIVVTFMAPQQAVVADPSARSGLVGDLMGLGAGASFGMITVAVRTTRLSEAPATQTLFYQLAMAFVVLPPVALLMGQTTFHATPMVWLSLGFQTIVVSFVSYLIWFWLLTKYLAARLGVLAFMAPLFGVLAGAWLLQERLAPTFLVGAALALVGLVIVNSKSWRRPRPRREPREACLTACSPGTSPTPTNM